MQAFDITGIIKKPIRKKCLLVLALLLILPQNNFVFLPFLATQFVPISREANALPIWVPLYWARLIVASA
ncbi:MAG: hypothetical protein COZ20_02930 [Gallionellales bacterium CG_4_10_14_3_um_filter_54_96]|nr:MAG: hypothetical protein COZ20_02930 [Gallionellales bacterium CG_4_10_14_3_um_filter_54_96]